MRRLLLTFAALALAIPAVAQEPPRWANKFFSGKDEPPPPVILQDFGTLPKGTIKTYRFKMTNIYAVPMQVKVPDPSCNCLSVIEYTGQMNPRDTGHIDVRINTSQVEGPKSVLLNVKFEGRDPKTNEKFWSYAKLEVRVVSRADIAINPGAIDFGVVGAGQKAAKVVSIFYSGRQRGWNITDVAYKKELMDVAVVPVAARGGIAFQLTATLKANAPAGAVDEQIVLKTNDPAAPALSLNVGGTIQAPLSLAPSDQMKFGPVEVGKKLDKVVIVRADKEFKVKSVEGQGDGVTVALPPLAARKSQPVTVTFSPEKTGPVKKVLTIKTDAGESVTLTVEGIGTEPR